MVPGPAQLGVGAEACHFRGLGYVSTRLKCDFCHAKPHAPKVSQRCNVQVFQEEPCQVTRRGMGYVRHAFDGPVMLGMLGNGILQAVQRRMQVIAVLQKR